MENASKALIIAAAILIAIVLISLGVMVLGQGSQLVKNTDMSEVEISTFNSQFEHYFGERVSGTNVKQLESKVKQHNLADKERQIDLKGASGVSGKVYSVVGDYDTQSGLLNKITVTELKSE